ncbi:MAG: RNA-binding S4 domain-containing protein [Muribaculaceae bacterium]|nr:RNA-binding S4 domain-containing protein [Muribaculaceae bacterium]
MENENMTNDQGEKKPKRPRIGAQPAAEAHGRQAHYESYRRNVPGDENHQDQAPRRPYNNNNTYPRRNNYGNYGNSDSNGGEQSYQPRNNSYNRYSNNDGNSYPRRNQGYQSQYPRRNYDYNRPAPAEHGEETEGAPRRYQPRPQQGYQNNREGGYKPRPNNGNGYNQQQRPNGGYHQQQRQGGYNQNRPGGYNNQNRPGNGYNQNRPGGFRQQRPQRADGSFVARGKSFTPRPKRIEYEQPVPDPNEEIRLNKYMSNAGLCSRREADEFIQQGLVKVNGNVVTELGTKITAKDVVEYDGKVVTLESKCYILLNKPKDCVTTSDDPNGRTTVLDLVKGACDERIYPVGRLDRNTTGVLLLTNDGDLASKLTHPKYVKKKIYHVWCDKDIAEEDMQHIADGIELEDGPIHADAISYATETDRNQAGIEIHSGRNRIVRRIFESLGYHVTKLDRVYFAGLTKKNLPRGRWRYLTQEEVNFLKMGSFE